MPEETLTVRTADQTKKILIGIPCGSGMMPAYTVDGLFKLTRPCPTSLLIIERQAVDAARNYILELAIKMQVDYVMFADDDGVLPNDTLVKLMEDDKDIVGAPMMTRNVREDGKHRLCCFEKYEDFDIGDGKTMKKYRSIEKFDTEKGHLHQVDAIGGACFLIKRAAFEALFAKHNGKPFEFLHEVIQTSKGVTVHDLSEDICFSERAKAEGFEIWVDTRIRPVHLGKPEFVRFEQAGEALPSLVEPLKGCITLSENLKNS